MSNQFGDTRIDDDLTLLSETLEEVLRASAIPVLSGLPLDAIARYAGQPAVLDAQCGVLAINPNDAVSFDHSLTDGDEVAFFPPVTGG